MDFLGEKAERITCSAPIIMVVMPVGVFIRNTGVQDSRAHKLSCLVYEYKNRFTFQLWCIAQDLTVLINKLGCMCYWPFLFTHYTIESLYKQQFELSVLSYVQWWCYYCVIIACLQTQNKNSKHVVYTMCTAFLPWASFFKMELQFLPC